MAKYDWKSLKKEYLLSEYNSVTSFLAYKNIKVNGSVYKNTAGWKKEKEEKKEKKSRKVVEKVIEKEAEKEAEIIVSVDSLADMLMEKIYNSINELDQHICSSKTKITTKKTLPNKTEVVRIEENENLNKVISVIDRKGLSLISSALKNINDVKNSNKPTKEDEIQSEINKVEDFIVQIKKVAENDTN